MNVNGALRFAACLSRGVIVLPYYCYYSAVRFGEIMVRAGWRGIVVQGEASNYPAVC